MPEPVTLATHHQFLAPTPRFHWPPAAVPHRDLVDDVLAQLRAAKAGPLEGLRADTAPATCVGRPTFDGSADISADADLIADGLLIEFKSTRNVHDFELVTIQQLLGYTLMDYTHQHRTDTVGVYLTRAAALITWPLEAYLALLGARRDLTQLRVAFADLLGHNGCRADDDPRPEQLPAVERLLADLAPVIPAGCCKVCAQPLARPTISAGRPRLYCSTFCSERSKTLRRHGWLD